MHQIANSAHFKDLENNSLINLNEVIKNANKKTGSFNNTSDLKQMLNGLLTKNVSDMEPQIAKNVQLGDHIDLMIQVDPSEDPSSKNQDTLRQEQF